MYSVTGFHAASLRINSVVIVSIYVAPPCPEFMNVMPQVSDNRLESFVYSSRSSIPMWLATVEKRIRDSVVPYTYTTINDGRWLNREVADAGIDFFQKTADLLTGEPFIYSSHQGDLVAEFNGEHGTMTSIVSSTFVLLFAVVDKVPVERKVSETGRLRDEVRHLTELLRTGHHGAVEATG